MCATDCGTATFSVVVFFSIQQVFTYLPTTYFVAVTSVRSYEHRRKIRWSCILPSGHDKKEKNVSFMDFNIFMHRNKIHGLNLNYIESGQLVLDCGAHYFNEHLFRQILPIYVFISQSIIYLFLLIYLHSHRNTLSNNAYEQLINTCSHFLQWLLLSILQKLV